MLTWTDCPARTPQQQIIFAQLEILRRLDFIRTVVAIGLCRQEREGLERL